MRTIALLTLLGVVAMAAPARDATKGSRTLAARSFQSGGLTCYYQCQSSTNDVDYGNVALSNIRDNGDGTTSCIYTSDADCTYNAATGVFVGTHFVTDCASFALGPVCGQAPAGSFKKRTTRVLGQTRDLDAIASRQAKVGRTRHRVAAAPLDPANNLF